MFKFFKDLDGKQKNAIDISKSIAVSAGAGSGKTRVLTARILKLIEEGYNIDEIVAITFTEKASLEMQKRVRGALLEEIDCGDEERKVFLQNQLDRLSNAKISTIHSFCFNIIKENAAILGMDFNPELILGVDLHCALRTIFKEEIEKLQENEKIYTILLEVSKGNCLEDKFIDDLIKVRSDIFNNYNTIEEVYNLSNKDIINEAIFTVISNVNKKYLELKITNNLVDNDDLLILADKLLENEDIREFYRQRYKVFLVDEFQDTNEIQRKLLYHLVSDINNKIEPARLFIVGDKKQGIYSFRGADCTIFNKVTSEISNLDKTSGKTVLLDTCYRSKENIVKGINEIFSVSIEDYEKLEVNKKEVNKDKDLKRILYLLSEESEIENPLNDAASIVINENNDDEVERQLEFIRDNINKFIQNNNPNYSIAEAVSFLTSKGYKYEDICVLVRRKEAIETIETELKKVNIPYCVIGGRNFYKKEEIQLLINLYEIAIRGFSNLTEDNDIKIILKVLRSFLFNIPDDIIFKVKNSMLDLPMENSFVNLVDIYIDSYKYNDEIKSLVLAVDKLKEISELGKKYSTYMLLNKMIETLDIDTAVLALDEGPQKYRNIEKFLGEVFKFDNKELKGDSEFLEYLRLLEEEDKETAEATLDTEESKAVKIMTVHMSKGLEFKTVIFPESDYKFIKSNNKPCVVYHNDNIIVKEDVEARKDIDLLRYSNYDNDNKIASIEEEIRVLYVAMTRAEEYFIFTGKGPNSPKKEINSYNEVLQVALNANKEIEKYFNFISSSEIDVSKNTDVSNEVEIKFDAINKKLSFEEKTNYKRNISASTYMSYKNCPRRYYLEKVLKLDASYLPKKDEEIKEEAINVLEEDNTKLSGSALGTIVHEVLEGFNGELMSTNEIEDSKVRGYIENFNVIENKNKQEKAHKECRLLYSANEIPFTYALENNKDITVTGFIDRLDLYEQNGRVIAEVIDYKTNRISSAADVDIIIEHYKPQLLLYGKVVKDLLGEGNRSVDVIIPILYLLANGTTVEYDFNEGLVNELFDSISDVFKKDSAMESIEDFSAVETDNCNYCNYCTLYK